MFIGTKYSYFRLNVSTIILAAKKHVSQNRNKRRLRKVLAAVLGKHKCGCNCFLLQSFPWHCLWWKECGTSCTTFFQVQASRMREWELTLLKADKTKLTMELRGNRFPSSLDTCRLIFAVATKILQLGSLYMSKLMRVSSDFTQKLPYLEISFF